MLKYRSELFAARLSNELELLVLSAFYTIAPPRGGVDYKSARDQLSVSLFRPGELLATSYGLFLKETSNLHISGTPGRTATQLRMEVHMGKRYRLISIGRYRRLRETKIQHFEAGTRFDFQLGNSTAPKRLELGLQNFTWT